MLSLLEKKFEIIQWEKTFDPIERERIEVVPVVEYYIEQFSTKIINDSFFFRNKLKTNSVCQKDSRGIFLLFFIPNLFGYLCERCATFIPFLSQ